MRAKITSEIQRAIQEYLDDHGLAASSFAQSMNWSPSTVLDWLNGETKYISPRFWHVMEPLLARYLPKPRKSAVLNGNTRTVGDDEVRLVPVVGFACAAGYEPALEPVDDFMVGHGDSQVPFTHVKPGCFALRVDGNSMEPSFPDGTLLLVSGTDFPENGDLVAAKLSDEGGSVVVKHYTRRGDTVILSAENPRGQSYEIKVRSEPGRLVWAYPVIRAEIDLRKQRRLKWNGNS